MGEAQLWPELGEAVAKREPARELAVAGWRANTPLRARFVGGTLHRRARWLGNGTRRVGRGVRVRSLGRVASVLVLGGKRLLRLRAGQAVAGVKQRHDGRLNDLPDLLAAQLVEA